MVCHRVLGDRELSGNLAVCQPRCHELRDLHLAWCQREAWTRPRQVRLWRGPEGIRNGFVDRHVTALVEGRRGGGGPE